MADNDVVKALLSLDPKDDTHWTDDGLPSAQAVSKLAGRTVKRNEITDADPKFTRELASGVKPVEQPKLAEEAAPKIEGATVKPQEPEPVNQGESAEVRVGLEGQIAELEAKLITKQAVVADHKRQMDEAQREADIVNAQLSELVVKRDAMPGHHANQKGILDYIAKQNELRLEKHKHTMALRAAGFTAKDFLGAKSPLDNAMARKNTRGTQRPNLAATVVR